ncbi:hypothetical protein NC651_037943 [Populus alba x Populus x berolinensis]|nr:hypothetical protein NC651_037943 [Populus alba x Populus x berolinensis]
MEQKLSRRPHIQPRVHCKYMGVSKFDDITCIGKQILRINSGELTALGVDNERCIVSSAIALSLLSSGRTTFPRSGLSFRLNSAHFSDSLAKHCWIQHLSKSTLFKCPFNMKVPAVDVIRYCVTLSATDGGTSLANPTSLILLTKLRSSKMLAGFRSRCTSGSGFVWWRNSKPVPISAAMRNLNCHDRGGVFPLQKRRSSKLPLAINSYTKHPYSGQAPRRRTIECFFASGTIMQMLLLYISAIEMNDCMLLPRLMAAGHFHVRRVIIQNAGNMLSMLALPELTNDISLSGTESSPYDFPFKPLLVNGDLFSEAKNFMFVLQETDRFSLFSFGDSKRHSRSSIGVQNDFDEKFQVFLH